jgi:hypothetical protein
VKKTLPNIFLQKYSLLLLSIGLFILSFIFNTLYSNKSSVTREVRLLERYLHRQQDDFDVFLKDTLLIRSLVEKKESLPNFDRIAAKGYGIFIIAENAFGGTDIKFWSNQLILPPSETYVQEDGEYPGHLANGYYLTVKKTIALNTFSDKIIVYAVFPVQSDFFIETDYLPQQFVYSSSAAKRVLISKTLTDFPVWS